MDMIWHKEYLEIILIWHYYDHNTSWSEHPEKSVGLVIRSCFVYLIGEVNNIPIMRFRTRDSRKFEFAGNSKRMHCGIFFNKHYFIYLSHPILTIRAPCTPLPLILAAYSLRSIDLSHSITLWLVHSVGSCVGADVLLACESDDKLGRLFNADRLKLCLRKTSMPLLILWWCRAFVIFMYKRSSCKQPISINNKKQSMDGWNPSIILHDHVRCIATIT